MTPLPPIYTDKDSPYLELARLEAENERMREVLELTRSRLHGRTDLYGLRKRIDDVLRGVKV